MDGRDKPLEDNDPFEPVSMAFPAPPGTDPLLEMGRAFIEEFASLGWKPGLILRLFKDPFYQGPYMLYEARGEEAVCELIDEVFGAVKEVSGDA